MAGVIPDNEIGWTYGGGQLSDTMGNAVTFTASKTAGTGSGTPAPVTATINSETKAVDFTVFSPTNLTWQWVSEGNQFTPATNMASAVSIGAESFFNFQITPTNVSFANVLFSESIPAQSWTWPDGTTGTRQANQIQSDGTTKLSYQVQANNFGFGPDDVSSGLFPKSRLFNGSFYQDINVVINIPEYYQDDNGAWNLWLSSENHTRAFTGATLSCQITATALNSQSGSPQGPWQNQPAQGN